MEEDDYTIRTNVVPYSDALTQIAKIGIPSIISMISSFLVQVVNVSFAGHLGSEAAMAGVGMANMFQNILCFSVIYGFNSSLNTLVS